MEQSGSSQRAGESSSHSGGEPTGGEPVGRPSSSGGGGAGSTSAGSSSAGTGASAASASMPPAQQRTLNESFSQLDAYADRARVALPAAPPGLLEGYMRWAPWVAIVFGGIGVVLSLLFLLFGALMSPFLLLAGAEGVSAGSALFLVLLVNLLSSALQFLGGYLMLQRRATGWWLLAVGMVVSFLSSLVHGSIVVLIFVALIAYIHLQVKPNYR